MVDGTTDRITITNHGFVANQLVTYTSGGDRFLDARDLIVNNIDYIIEESIGYLKATYPNLNLDPTLESKCARDTRLVVAAWTNDLKYGGNYFSRDAAERIPMVQMFNMFKEKNQRLLRHLTKQETCAY